MARGGNRNVNLLIRAKDETTKVVNTIARAMEGLSAEADDLKASADGSSNSLVKIGKALASFNKEFRGQSGPAKLAAEFEKAESAAKGLETALESSRGEAVELAKAQTRLAAETEKFAAEAKEAAAALEREAAAAAKLKTEEREVAAVKRALSGELSKQNTALRRNAAAIEGTEVRLKAAVERTEELRAAQAAAEKTTARQRATLASSEKNVERLNGLLREYQLQQAEVAARVEVANAAVEKQKATLAGVTSSVEAQRGAVARLVEAEKQAALVAVEAAQAQDALEKEVRKVASVIERQSEAFEKGKVELQQFGAALGKADVSVRQFAAGVKGTLQAAIDEQNRALLRSKRELREQEAVLLELRRALQATNEPTKELVRDFARASAGSQVMRQEVKLQADALAEMRAELARTGDSYDDVVRAQAAFVGTQGRTGQGVSTARGTTEALEAMERTRIAAARAREEFAKVDREAREVGASLAMMGPPTFAQAQALANLRQYQGEMDATARAVAQMDGAMTRAARGTITYEEATRRVGASSRQMNAALTAARTEGNATRTTLDRVGSGAAGAGEGGRRGAAGLRAFWEALRRINTDGRQSLSVMERIRGQLLSLAAAYGGVFGAIEGFRGIITVFRAVEAAQSRLNVVYDSDQAAVAKDMDFLRRTADRLGQSFTVLSNNYTKFAAATQGTVLAGDETRRIFTVMSEAARVYKLDQEQLNGTFVALTQIASKGKIQLEELSGQLGDRLPGVLQILADGMGLVTDETGTATSKLLDMTQAGLVGSENLSKLADGFASRIDGKLGAALETTSAEIDTFFKNVENTFLRIANGGFIDGFTRFLSDVNDWLQSAEAASFFDRLSAGMEKVFDVSALLVRNIDLLAAAVSALIAYKLSGYVVAVAGAFASWATASTAAAAAARTAAVASASTTTAMTASAGAAGTARVAVVGLTAALRGLLSSTGVGLLLVGASVAFSTWATSADDATESLTAHRKMVDEVKNAYDSSAGSADKWKASLDKLSGSQASANTTAQRKALQELKDSVGGGTSIFGNPRSAAYRDAMGSLLGGRNKAVEAQLRSLEDARKAMEEGGKTAEDYKKTLDDIANNAATPAVKEYALAEQERTDAIIAQNAIVREAELLEKIKTGTTEEATAAIEQLTGAVSENATALDVKARVAAEKFKSALDAVKETVPELKAELDLAEEIKNVNDLVAALNKLDMDPDQRARADAAIAAARNNLGSLTAQNQFEAATGSTATAGSIVGQAAKFLGQREGNTGLADFILGSDPSKAIDRNLATAWCAAFVNAVLESQGIKSTGKANAKSYLDFGTEADAPRAGDIAVYHRGKKGSWQGHVAIVESVNPDGSVNIIGGNQSGPGSNGASNMVSRQTRAASDAISYRRPPTRAESAVDAYREEERAAERQRQEDERAEEKARREAERAEERRQQFREDQDQRNTELQAEIDGEGVLSREAAIQAELAEREAAAKKAGGALTPEDVDLITRATGAEWDRAEAKRAQTKANEEQEAVEKRVSDLQAQRAELEKQRDLYREQGDTEAVTTAEAEIAAVNVQLREAISLAEAFWSNLGGEEAATKLAALKTASLELNKAKTEFLSWKDVGEMAATGLTNAFDKFAEAVASGKNIGEAARDAFLQFASDFLRQIAQMILKQALLNAISSFMPGSGGIGSLLGIGAPVKHGGGVIGGASSRTRNVSPAVFANAARFHTGGLPGLRSDEVPAILQKGEEVLAKGDARNVLNGGGKAANVNVPPAQVKVVNTFDGGSFLSEGLGTVEGEQAIMNFMRANSSAIKGMLG